MQFTRFTDYSLRVLMYLAQVADRLVTVRELADYYGISQNHLVKVVHNLAQLGHITSTKGKGGGIRLLTPAQQLNLQQLILQLEPNLLLVECFDQSHDHCRISGFCGLKPVLQQAMQQFLDHLAQYTLADTLPPAENSGQWRIQLA